MKLKWRPPKAPKKKKVTKERLLAILEGIRYKNWTFRLETLSENKFAFVAEFIVPDSSFEWYLKRPVSITTGMTIPTTADFDDEEIVEHVWEMISKTEIHEAAEWFEYKGEKIHYPH